MPQGKVKWFSAKKGYGFITEEEKTLEWNDVQLSLEKNFGSEIYKSWLKNIVPAYCEGYS